MKKYLYDYGENKVIHSKVDISKKTLLRECGNSDRVSVYELSDYDLDLFYDNENLSVGKYLYTTLIN